jgi:hypothetical protein
VFNNISENSAVVTQCWYIWYCQIRKYDNIIHSLRFACCLYKARDTNSEYVNLIAFSHENIYSTVPQYDGYTFVACRVGKLCCWSTSAITFPHGMYKRNIFNKRGFNQTNSTTEVTYSSQASKIYIKISAYPCNPARFAKAYVNHFLAPPTATYSHRVHLYWMPERVVGGIVEGEKWGGDAARVEIWKRFVSHSLVN